MWCAKPARSPRFEHSINASHSGAAGRVKPTLEKAPYVSSANVSFQTIMQEFETFSPPFVISF
jgi:hypothetical protein